MLGAPGDGWRIARSTLATERVAMGAGIRRSSQTARRTGPTPRTPNGPGFHVATARARRPCWVSAARHPAIRKLLGIEHRQAVAETALALLGPDGAAEAEASQEFLLTRCLSIAGGTTQILLTVVAERVLGLPR